MTTSENILEGNSIFKKAEYNNFHVARSEAIERYGQVEHTLLNLLSILSGTTQTVTAILFFKMNNAYYRRKILKQLMEKKLDSKYFDFFSSYIRLVQQLDDKRNEIVHWRTASHINDLGFTHYGLVPTEHWYDIEKYKVIKKEDLLEFTKKSSFVARLGNIFYLELTGLPQSDIFLEKADYPPPIGHPLYDQT